MIGLTTHARDVTILMMMGRGQTSCSCHFLRKMSEKRVRTKNFSEYEKTALTDIVKKYPLILSKAKDCQTNKEKEVAWRKVLEEFNIDPLVSERDIDQLKGCLTNLTTKAKKENARPKRTIHQTGGGPGEGTSISASSEVIIGLLPQVFTSMEVPDSDAPLSK
jgi:hypothetical protein